MSNRQSASSLASLLNRASQQLHGGRTPNDSLRSSASIKPSQRRLVKSSWQDEDDADDDVQSYLNDLTKKTGAEDSKRATLKELGLGDLSLSESESDNRTKPMLSGSGSKFLKSKVSVSPARSVGGSADATPARKEQAQQPPKLQFPIRKLEIESRLADEVPEIDLDQLSSTRLSSADSPKRSSLRLREDNQRRLAEKRSVSFEQKQAGIGVGVGVATVSSEDEQGFDSDRDRRLQASKPAIQKAATSVKRADDRESDQVVADKSVSESIAEEIGNMLVIKPNYSFSSSAEEASDTEKKPFSFNLMTVDDLDDRATVQRDVDSDRDRDRGRDARAEQTPRSVHTDSSRSVRKLERSKSDDADTVEYSNTFEDDAPQQKPAAAQRESSRDRDVPRSDTQLSYSNTRSDSEASRSDKRKRESDRHRSRRRHKHDTSYSLSTQTYSDDDRSVTITESHSSDRRRHRHRHGHTHTHTHTRVDMHQVQMSITRALTDTLIGRLTNAVAASMNAAQYVSHHQRRSNSLSHSSHSVVRAEARSDALNVTEVPFFNQLLSQQVGLTKQTLLDQQRLYAEASVSVQPDYRYETLQDVRQFVAQNRQRYVHVRSFEEALREVLNEN